MILADIESLDWLLTEWPVLILAVLAGILIHYLCYLLLQALTPSSVTDDIRFVMQKLRYPTLLAFILVFLKVALSLLSLQERTTGILQHAFSITLIIALTWAATGAVKIFRWLTLRHYDTEQKDNLVARQKVTQFRILERIAIAILVVIGISLVLMTFDSIRRLGAGLLASAGIAGIIVGFAAQRSIATLLAGIQIAITQPIRIDDAVVVESEWGWIEEINLTYVVIRIWDQRRLVVPINYFIERPFQNWTKKSADILGAVFLYTDYKVKIDAIRSELDRLLESNSLWDGRVKVVQVTDTTEKSVVVRILVSAADSPSLWDLRVHIREKMISFLQENYPESLPRSRVKLENMPSDSERSS